MIRLLTKPLTDVTVWNPLQRGVTMRSTLRRALYAISFFAIPIHQLVGQTHIVTGRVTDSLTADVLTSGQVSVQGSTLATTVREDGTFTLAVPARDVTLVVRSIGYKSKSVVIPASQSSATVVLARDYFQLEAIVVTG